MKEEKENKRRYNYMKLSQHSKLNIDETLIN